MSRSGWAKNLRLRVSFNFTKPLRRFISIARGGGKGDVWRRVIYERLLLFCYCCSIVCHTESDCEHAGDGFENGGVK